MRTIQVTDITEQIKEMCIEANHFLTDDMKEALVNAQDTEEAMLGKQILQQLQENLRIAGEDMIPICQDTGMAVIFMEIGQDVHFEGGSLEDAINEGVRRGYVDGYLRKSVVKDPLIRENTKDNTPAIIHYEIVPGDQVRITVAPKGFGSENMSRVFMLKPADGIIPELVGRLPVIAVLDDLDEDALVKILSEPKNAILKQYSYMFSLDGIELEITDDAMRAIAKKAAERKTGARGLRTVVEEALSDIMFDAPSDDTISKVILTGECVTDGKAPEVIRDPSARKSRRNSEKKTAKKNPA